MSDFVSLCRHILVPFIYFSTCSTHLGQSPNEMFSLRHAHVDQGSKVQRFILHCPVQGWQHTKHTTQKKSTNTRRHNSSWS